MTFHSEAWDTIRRPAHHYTVGPVRAVVATPRPHGALRYRCPVTGSFVLVTDEATLRRIAGPRVRLPCMDCGETHLLMQDADQAASGNDPAVIVAASSKP